MEPAPDTPPATPTNTTEPIAAEPIPDTATAATETEILETSDNGEQTQVETSVVGSQATVETNVECTQTAAAVTTSVATTNTTEEEKEEEEEEEDEDDNDLDPVSRQLKQLSKRMNKYEKQVRRQDSKILQLEEEVERKNEELEQQRKSLQEVTFLKNRLKEKEKELATMKQEFNRHRNIVADLQGNMKQIHNQMKTMTDQTFEMDDRLGDIEKLSPMMGVFEWRIENYKYHSLNSEFLTSPEFFTHLNGYSCYISVQWFGNKNGRIGLYLHLNEKKNQHLVENCKIKMLIQCVGNYGLTKEHLVEYDDTDTEAADTNLRHDDAISGDDYFLLKPYLDKYLIDDCLYIYCHMLPNPDYA